MCSLMILENTLNCWKIIQITGMNKWKSIDNIVLLTHLLLVTSTWVICPVPKKEHSDLPSNATGVWTWKCEALDILIMWHYSVLFIFLPLFVWFCFCFVFELFYHIVQIDLQLYCVVKDELKLLSPRPLPPNCSDFSCVPQTQFVMLGIEPRPSHMRGEYFVNWATSLTPVFMIVFT